MISNQTKNELRGWDWIRSLMEDCPRCGWKPSLGNKPFSKKWQIACFNCTCGNLEIFEDDNPFIAILKWNTKMKTGKNFDEDKYRQLKYDILQRKEEPKK